MNARQLFEKIPEERRIFWEETYRTLSLDERRNVWSRKVHSGMRRQPEETPDPYDAFSKKWHDFAKSVAPDFDTIFEYVIKTGVPIKTILIGKNTESAFQSNPCRKLQP